VALGAIVAFILSGWIGKLTAKGFEKAKVEKSLAHFLGSIARWAFLVLCIMALLGALSVQMIGFAAVIGAGGLAIGLALQGSLSNLAAGVMLMIFRPLKVDDVVEVAGELGKVKRIELFTTQIDTPDNRRIIIPNGQIFGSTIENITHNPVRRVDVAVGVEYKADLDRTREVLEAAGARVPGRIDNPPPQIILLSLGNSSVDWQVRVWCNTDDYWTVRDAATREVKMSLDNAGLGIPFPQMDVHMDSPAASVN
jgi:small conductance mechanosensitive channel